MAASNPNLGLYGDQQHLQTGYQPVIQNQSTIKFNLTQPNLQIQHQQNNHYEMSNLQHNGSDLLQQHYPHYLQQQLYHLHLHLQQSQQQTQQQSYQKINNQHSLYQIVHNSQLQNQQVVQLSGNQNNKTDSPNIDITEEDVLTIDDEDILSGDNNLLHNKDNNNLNSPFSRTTNNKGVKRGLNGQEDENE
jgi:hypothetical protein